jgi:hypothetical protein
MTTTIGHLMSKEVCSFYHPFQLENEKYVFITVVLFALLHPQ